MLGLDRRPIRIQIVRVAFASARPAAAGEQSALKMANAVLRQPGYILRW